jgi:hypothetical protein
MRSTFVVLLALAACSPAGIPDPMGNGGGTAGTGGNGGSSNSGGGSATGGSGSTGGGTTQPQNLTWYKDVLPVAQTRCMSCHQPGGIGTFSMQDKAAVMANAPAMAADVTSRKMPPWMIDDTCGGPFTGSLHLSDAEIALFNNWVANGSKLGNEADAPAPYQPPLGLATVDMNMAPAMAYTPQANVTDDYHCFIVDPQLTETKHVTAYEIDPGVAAEVHHVVLYLADRTQAQALDPNGTGWSCFGGAGTGNQTLLGAWAPGARATTFPTGTGIPLPASQVIVMQLHYNLQNGVREPDTTHLKLQFASGPVTEATMQFIVDFGFSVPPNAMGYTHSKTFTLPGNVTLWGAFEHMHTQGHTISMTTDDDCLLTIPKWDFNWQQTYFYAQPKQLAQGSHVKLQCTWDNTTSNTLTFGENTSDEMCVAAVYITQTQ